MDMEQKEKEQVIRQLGIPWDEESDRIELSANSLRVLARRYLRKDLEGKIIESPAQMFRRVAYHVAKADLELGGTEEDVERTTETFYEFLTAFRFMPNSPTFTGAGTPLGQLAACFTEDMRVVTDKGLKRIADLQVGDRVLTHKGRFRPVTETMQRHHEGDLYRIKVKLIGVTLEVTPEHPIFTPEGWVEAKDLKVGDLVAVGVPQGETPPPTFDLAQLPYAEELEVQVSEEAVRVRRPSTYQNSGRQAEWVHRFITLTPELARLCGYYVAEGTIGPDERYVRFTLGKEEREYQEDIQELLTSIFGRSPTVTNSNHGRWTNVDFYSRVVAAWFKEHFGSGSNGKFIPTWLMYASQDIQEEFLVGLLRGDGMFFEKVYEIAGRKSPKTFRSFRITLANPGLVHQIWQMLLRLGFDPAIRPVDTTYVTSNASDTAQISMPPLRSRELIKRVFGVDLPEPDERYVRPHVHRLNGQPFFEIERIDVVPFSGTVYNCEVDEDHTYVTEGVVVHNCFVLPISDDMGREPDGIFMTLRNAALIQQTGGGNGFSFSRLRPRGDRVSTSAGTATGPVGFLKVYDVAFGEIAQGGCLVPETLVFTEAGTLRLDEIVDPDVPGWQPHHLHVATDEGWRTSPRGYNNGVKPVLRVRTSEGLEITGTPDHKVKVMTSEGPRWRPLSALRPGDAILVKLGQHRGSPQHLRHPERQHGNQVMPHFPDVLDEDLAFFLGYMVGDGFIAGKDEDHRLGVSVAHSSYLLEEMPRLIRRLFGDHVRVHRQQKEGDASVTLVLDNRALKEFFLLNGMVKPASAEAFVPSVIRRSPPRVVAAFLRGLFEADGTVVHGYPELVTTSERLAREVATLLIGLGMPVRLQVLADGAGRFGTRQRWRVRVVSHRGLKAWRSVIGCDSRSRFAQVCEFTPDLDRESNYRLPEAAYWLSPVLEAITLPQTDRQGRGQGKKFRATDPALRRRLLRYVRGERQLTLSAYEALFEAYAVFREHAPQVDDLWFVHVTAVEEAGERLTLDLEVDENHTYLAWGLVTHNTRRGANMGVLRVDHPDIFDFIRAKEKEGELTNFNLSVGITDEFMRAVEEDREFDLVNPRDGKVWRTVRAREIFDEIVRHAHYNGEPGALFLDTANRTNPLPHLYELEATNPCGEQFLGPYENCCLGSINLAKHVKEVDGKRVVDWDLLQDTVERAVHFLDNVVTANAYVPAVPQLKEAAHKARRIGLGIMGLGDIMYDLGVRYGSEEGQEFAAQIMEFIRYHAMRKSIELAKERGPFPAIKGSIYDPEDLKWRPPEWPDWLGGGPRHDWGRPPLDWEGIVEGIKRYGIRNAAQLTVAPTGTIATVSGCEGYGCEPVFALAYIRHFKDEDRDVELEYVSPRFLRALEEAHLDEETKRRIIDEVFRKGTCQGIEELPEEIRHVFVVAQDITAEEHVRMQAALQIFVDNSISKTINFPETATVNDVAEAYKLAWKLGCKGITVYVTGSRDQVVLETREVKEKKKGTESTPSSVPVAPAQESKLQEWTMPVENVDVRPRPMVLHGKTYRRPTPVGTAWITVNSDDRGEPFEVFLNVGKAGSDVAADSEAMGRLISLILRMPSPLSPRERMRQIVHQLIGIGGGRSMGFGAQRVRSLPDAIAQVLQQYLDSLEQNGDEGEPPPQQLSFTLSLPEGNGDKGGEEKEIPAGVDTAYGDICPECGLATLIPFEGCKRCTNCGYSEC